MGGEDESNSPLGAHRPGAGSEGQAGNTVTSPLGISAERSHGQVPGKVLLPLYLMDPPTAQPGGHQSHPHLTTARF